MKATVTGGAGFVGRHLVERLRRDGYEVSVVDLPTPGLELTCSETGAQAHGCDLCTGTGLDEAAEGADVVFHIAAFASPWGAREKFWAVNVDGTENMLRAAKKAGVKRFVHCSSTASVFDGWTHHDKVDETFPYPNKFLSAYGETKSISERMVLAANCDCFKTVSIRPHVIWGPRDQTFFGRIKTHAEKGPIYHVGGGRTVTDTTYVENLVEGLVLASKSDKAPGNAYFITNGEPTTYADFINRHLEIMKLPPAKGSIPGPLAYGVGAAFEAIWDVLKIKKEPLLSRYAVAELMYTHTYKLDKAKRDLGYEPPVSTEEGFKKLEAWAREEGLID